MSFEAALFWATISFLMIPIAWFEKKEYYIFFTSTFIICCLYFSYLAWTLHNG